MLMWFKDTVLNHPARGLVVSFAAAIAVGTMVLLLPAAAAAPGRASLVTALFTATSAVCVTGLVVVDTGEAWSGFGQTMILLLIQIGGLGIMTLATLIPIALTKRASVSARLVAQSHTGALTFQDVKIVMRGVIALTVTVESVVAVVLALRFWLSYDYALGTALAEGVFHAVSAFNNAGFSLYSDSLERFAGDWVVNVAIMTAIVLGGIGFAVVAELATRHGIASPPQGLAPSAKLRARLSRRVRAWTLHTKLTVFATVFLLVGGMAVICILEWTNNATLGTLSVSDKLLAGGFQSVTTRTAGFNTVDISQLHEPTRLLMSSLMFVGGGSGSTAGGIKVGTFAVLVVVVLAEIRGDRDANVAHRRLPPNLQRQALVVFAVALAAGFAGSFLLDGLTDFPLESTAFEAFSALGTVGLSVGITPGLDTLAQITVVAMMFLGRIGPVTLGSALVARKGRASFRYPEDRPLIG